MWQFVKNYTFKYWKHYLLGFIALMITNYVATIIPLKIKEAIDFIEEPERFTEGLKPIILSIISLSLILAATRSLSRIFIFIPGRNIEYDLRNNLYKHLLTLSSDYFQKEKVGDVMSRLINDIQSLRAMSALGFLHILNTIMIYIFVISQMMTIHLPLTLYIIAPIPIIMILVKGFVTKFYVYIRKNQRALGALTDTFLETIASIQVIKSYGSETSFHHALQKPNNEYLNLNMTLAKIRSILFPFIGSSGSIGHLILLVVGGHLIIQDHLSLGEFTAFLGYIILLTWPTAALAWIINIIQRGRVSLDRLNHIFEYKPLIIDKANINLNKTIDHSPSITVENLTYSYPNSNKPSLIDINFSIKPSQSLGIFGTTGSGKTTLANLLARVENIPTNTYFINDIECSQWSIQALREGISYVPQNPFLFS